jgi:hypothetical protein
MRGVFSLRAGAGLFVLLSAADYLQTYVLIAHGPAHEANPVAAEWLDRHGWAGLALFKGLVTLAVLLAVGLLAGRRSPAAGRVLAVGCATLLAVGVYSRGLVTADPPADPLTMVTMPEPGPPTGLPAGTLAAL